MRISELARQADLTPDTIRFYEKMGLLDESHFSRQENNYRDYHESALARLELVRFGQEAGFKLAEMAGVLRAWENDEITREQKRAFFLQRLEQIALQMEKLEAMRTYVLEKLEMFGDVDTEIVEIEQE
ncbi:MAG: MerR family transcriptional regulator [Chloroflexi bacterium]|nr:MerR family transcriptional regulator [Chloroflexota bacterium]